MSWCALGRENSDENATAHAFRWLEQAALGEERASNTALSRFELADSWRYVGHSYFQAAYQSDSNSKFRERMEHSADAFTRAADAIGQDGAGSVRARFLGLALYCEAQIASDESISLARLHESHAALARAWRSMKESGNLSSPLAIELVYVTNDLMSYEPEIARRLPALETALEVAHSIDLCIARLNDGLRLVLLTEVSELLENAWMNLPEYEPREAAGIQSIQTFERLREYVTRASDPRCALTAFALQTYGSDPLPEKPLVVNAEQISLPVNATGDRVAIGSLVAASLRQHFSDIAAVEDPAEAIRLLSIGEAEADQALEELQVFGGIRRFNTSAGYVCWSLADLLVVYAQYFAESNEKRSSLVNRAVDVSYRIRELGPPIAVWGQYSNLGFYVFEKALLEKDLDKRRRILDEAYRCGLEYEAAGRSFGPHWELGGAQHFVVYGRIKRELANLPQVDRVGALREAIGMFEKTAESVQRVINSPLWTEPDQKKLFLAGIRYELGAAQLELYRLTRDSNLLDEALNQLRQSAEGQARQELHTRAAEALSRIADAYLLGGRFEQARSAFLEAAQRYESAAEHYPGLARAFHAQAGLMQARAATTSARSAYLREDYDQAAKSYSEACKLVKETESWQGLATLYEAWAFLAEADEQSREASLEAERAFQKAISKFAETERDFQIQADDRVSETQREILTLGRRYAEARIQLERARAKEREGKLHEAAQRLDETSRLFGALANDVEDHETKESIRSQAGLCRASMLMLQAEQSLNPELHAQAASLFEETQRSARSRSLAATAGGWAACCKALALGLRYRQSPDRAQFEALKKQLSAAHNYFLEAGVTTAANWVTGTQRMFDAMAYLAEAEARLDPTERKTLQGEAEKSLRVATQMFKRAGYVARQEDSLRYLESAIEHNDAALVPMVPVIQSVSGLATQTVAQELLSDGEAVETPALQAALLAPEGPLAIGHESHLALNILNTGQRIAVLVRIENLEHPDLEFASDALTIIDGNLDLRGKHLAPLQVHEVKLQITPKRAGRYNLQPKILSVSPQGDLTIVPVPAVTLDARELKQVAAIQQTAGGRAVTSEFGHEEIGLVRLDQALGGGIPLGYAVVLAAPPSDEARDMARSFMFAGLRSGKHVFFLTRDPSMLETLPKDELAKLSVLSTGELTGVSYQAASAKLSNLTELLLDVSKMVHKENETGKRTCMDFLSDILLQHGPLITRKFVSDLIRKLKAAGYTTLALLDPTLHETKEAQAVLGLFDGEIEIKERESDGTTSWFVRVKRMYDVPHSSEWVRLH